MPRIVDCPCGHTLSGRHGRDLVALAKQHVRKHHPDSSRSEDEIRQLVARMAQDA